MILDNIEQTLLNPHIPLKEKRKLADLSISLFQTYLPNNSSSQPLIDKSENPKIG